MKLFRTVKSKRNLKNVFSIKKNADNHTKSHIAVQIIIKITQKNFINIIN